MTDYDNTIRTLLYGPPGSGKTTAAYTAPGPILWINADRPTAARAAKRRHPREDVTTIQFDGRETFDKVYIRLKKGDHPYTTVVLDTLSEAYRILLQEFAGKTIRVNQGDYGDAQTVIDRWVRNVRDLAVNLIIIAHDETIQPEGQAAQTRPLTGGRKTPEVIMAAMDVVAYCSLVTDDDGTKRCMAQMIEAKGRRAKDGTDLLGDVREVDFAEWVALNAGLDEQKGEQS